MNGYFNDDNNDKNENKNPQTNGNDGFSDNISGQSVNTNHSEPQNPSADSTNSDNQYGQISYGNGYSNAQNSDYYSSGSTGDTDGTGNNGTGETNQNEYNSYGGNVQYKWNYDDYQKALDSKGKKPKKKRGLKVFVITVCAVAAVAVVSLAGVGIAALLRNDGLLPMIGGTSSGTTSATVINPNGPTLKTNSKPSSASSTSSTSAAATTGLSMTAQQVYSNVKNSVVIIETYDLTSLEATGAGSGIIMSADGYIITNEHVIDGASSIKVTLANKKEYPAKVIGYDLRTDLAVLKIDATGLTAATFGNSDQLNIAESVLAIGNSAGLGGSVTSGIVSALNMTVTTENNYTEKCIQTDAPINPGNSGGALVNMYGQVIGITSSKIEATGYEGMGFAIPINTAKPVIDSIIKYGYVTGRVKIGIQVNAIDPSMAAARGYPQGLLIANIDSSSDAATKGLQKNDEITKINGVAATTYDAFYAEESKYKPGDSVTLTIYRHSTNQTFDVSIKLAEDKGNTSTASSSSQSSNKSYGNGNGSNNQGGYSFGYGN